MSHGPDAPKVFISYSHKDEKWKDRLVAHLRVLQEQYAFDVWDDRRLAPGDPWQEAIVVALETATVAVLLVSKHFLTSPFILREEVRRILRRREREGLRVIPVILEPCAWQHIAWLSRIQAAPRDGQPLSKPRRKHELEETLTGIALTIYDFLLAARGESPSSMLTASGTIANGPDPAGDALRLGRDQEQAGEYAAAQATLRAEVDRLRGLRDRFPARADYRARLAAATMNLGNLLRRLGDRPGSKGLYAQTLDLLDELLDADPADQDLQNESARAHHNYGLLLQDEHAYPAAEEAFRKALRIRSRLLARDRGNPTVRQEVASTSDGLATTLKRMGPERRAEAEQLYRDALTIQEALINAAPGDAARRRDLAVTRGNLAALLQESRRFPEAEALFRRTQVDYEALVAATPGVPEYYVNLGITFGNWARLARAAGQPREARGLLKHAMGWYGKCLEALRQVAPWRHCFRKDHQLLFEVLVEMQDHGAAARHVQTFPAVLRTGSECIRLAALCCGAVSAVAAAPTRDTQVVEGARQAFEDGAMQFLGQAAERDAGGIAPLRSDPRFDPLRTRPDFQQLVRPE